VDRFQNSMPSLKLCGFDVSRAEIIPPCNGECIRDEAE
jgi:hypothetical protein